MIPRISRRTAVFLGKAAGALIFTAIGGVTAWLLEKERKSILDKAAEISEETELELDLPSAVEPENTPEDADGGEPEPEAEDET